MRWIRRRLELAGAALSIKDDLDILAEAMARRSSDPNSRRGRPRYVGDDGMEVGLSSVAVMALRSTDGYDGFDERLAPCGVEDAIDVLMVKRAIESAAPALAVDPDQCSFQLCGRLMSMAARKEGIAMAIVQSAMETDPRPTFLPEWQAFESPADPLRQTLETHGRVKCISVSPRAHLIAIGMHRGVVQLWDWDSSQMVDAVAIKDARDVHAVDWLASGREIVVGTSDSNAYVFCVDVPERAGPTPQSATLGRSGLPYKDARVVLRGHSGPVSKVAVSPSEREVENEKELIATGSHDYDIRIFAAEDGSERALLDGHSQRITDLTWVRLKSGALCVLSASADKTIRLFAVSGKRLRLFRGHTAPVTAIVSFAPQRPDWFASCSTDKSVKIWNLWTGRIVDQFRGNQDHIVALTALPDSRRLVAASQYFRLHTWDWGTKRAGMVIDRAHSADISCLAVTNRAEGARVLSGSEGDHTCKIWDMSGVQEEGVLSHHTGARPVHAVTVLPTNDNLQQSPQAVVVSCSKESGLCIWNVKTGERIAALDRLADAKGAGSLKGDMVTTIASIDARQLFVTGGSLGSVAVWCISNEKQIQHVRSLGRHEAAVLGIAPVKNPPYSLVSVSEDGELRFWDMDAEHIGKTLKVKKNAKCCSFAVSSVGRFLCLAFSDGSVGHCTAGEEFRWLNMNKVWGCVQAMAAIELPTSGLRRLVLAMGDGTLRIFEDQPSSKGGMKHVGTLEGAGLVGPRALSIVPGFQGQWVVTGSDDHTLRLWNTEMCYDEKENEDSFFARSSPLERRSSRRSPRGNDESFWDLVSSPVSAEVRQGDAVVVADMGTTVSSCRCFVSFGTSIGLGVAVGRSDGIVNVVRIQIV